MAILQGTSPREEQSFADAVAEVQMVKSTKFIRKIGPEKIATEGLIWPLHEGIEI